MRAVSDVLMFLADVAGRPRVRRLRVTARRIVLSSRWDNRLHKRNVDFSKNEVHYYIYKRGKIISIRGRPNGSQKLDPNRSNNKDFDGGVPASDGLRHPKIARGCLSLLNLPGNYISIIYLCIEEGSSKDEVDDNFI
jgi:hypothetical protein